jgi:hypothetical protein
MKTKFPFKVSLLKPSRGVTFLRQETPLLVILGISLLPQQVTEAPIIPSGFHRSKPSSNPFIIGQRSSSPQGQDQGLIPTTYFTQKAGEALRVTRGFRHE